MTNFLFSESEKSRVLSRRDVGLTTTVGVESNHRVEDPSHLSYGAGREPTEASSGVLR